MDDKSQTTEKKNQQTRGEKGMMGYQKWQSQQPRVENLERNSTKAWGKQLLSHKICKFSDLVVKSRDVYIFLGRSSLKYNPKGYPDTHEACIPTPHLQMEHMQLTNTLKPSQVIQK